MKKLIVLIIISILGCYCIKNSDEIQIEIEGNWMFQSKEGWITFRIAYPQMKINMFEQYIFSGHIEYFSNDSNFLILKFITSSENDVVGKYSKFTWYVTNYHSEYLFKWFVPAGTLDSAKIQKMELNSMPMIKN
jgi:hypothetical protein